MSRKRKEDDSSIPLRIGTVPYCNAWPLVHNIADELPGTIVSEWIPSSMRLRLMAHHLDLSLMPVAELMNLPYGKIIGNCCIACHGEVKSVRILSTKPLGRVETISLDTASRSSITACELILRHFFNVKPVRYRLEADRSPERCKTDAFLVIGDRALALRPSDRWEYRYDLGSLWMEKTGLPFVFAAWIGCSNRAWDDASLPRSLGVARDRALENIDRLLDEKENAAVPFPVSRSELRSYLTDSIVYRLGEEEKRGLQTFFDLALLNGLTRHRTVVDVYDGEPGSDG